LRSKISLPGELWLASDTHLSPGTPATTEAFLEFLDTASAEADAVLLLGDIFDAWIGDDVVAQNPPWLGPVLDGLRRAAERTPLWLGRGNRDFLIGQELARLTGARLLPEQALIDSDYGLILLTHGDEFCTDDQGYQQFRSMVRDPAWQEDFLSKPIPERLSLARQVRGESMTANQSKSADIMDVNDEAVDAAFRQTGVGIMVHGHTHRPERHVWQLEGKRRERWVLPDWDCDQSDPPRGGWLVIDRDGLSFYDLQSE
jgi:UDP-2,3-diacylglucosamine hydrolase